MLKPSTPLEELADHNVQVVQPGEGDILEIGDWSLRWKAQGTGTGFNFAIFETTLVPGKGLPLHKHPYPEFFYVLDGELSFALWDNTGKSTWVVCGPGNSVLAPSNAPHAFLNRSDGDVRFLGISTYHHERMLKDAVTPNGDTHHLPRTLNMDQFEALFRSMEENQVYVVADRAEP